MGLGGFLGKAVGGLRKKISIKGIIGGVKTLSKGGLVGGVAAVGSKIAKRIGRKNLKRVAIGGAVVGAGVAAESILGGGGGGGGAGEGRRYRRINPGNTRAMRRAIRRIEAGARIYSKFFSIRRGHIKGAPGVKVKTVRFRRSA